MASERTVTVTEAPTLLMVGDINRSYYIIQNQSTAVQIYLGHTEQVSTTGTRKGRVLDVLPSMENASLKFDPPEFLQRPVYAICGAGLTAVVWVEEG